MKKILMLAMILMLMLPLVFASSTVPETREDAQEQIESYVDGIINILVWFTSIIGVGVIIVGGIMIAIAHGDPEKIKKGKQVILWAIIGIAIVQLAGPIVKLMTP